jgi:cation:H+ antiporter
MGETYIKGGICMDTIIINFLETMPIIVLFIAIGILLFILGKGADILVDEAVSLSIHWGIPKIVVGATIVSLGTTLPEATVSILAALKGSADIALGNSVGSIISNGGLILGLAAIVGIVPVDKKTINKQVYIQVSLCLLLIFLCMPFFTPKGETGVITQWMGFLLVFMLILYIYFSIKWSKKGIVVENHELKEERTPVFLQVLKLIGGMVIVIVSSRMLIPTVQVTAIRIGIPESIIAATLVAFGTSLPELVTSITAVRKKHGELAVGNVAGANILNVLFVIGGSAAVAVKGLEVPAIFYYLHLPVMFLIVAGFWYFSKNKRSEINKIEGSMLILLYTAYIALSFILK